MLEELIGKKVAITISRIGITSMSDLVTTGTIKNIENNFIKVEKIGKKNEIICKYINKDYVAAIDVIE